MRSLKLIIICFFFTNVTAQTFDLEKYNIEKQEILNVIINSNPFDSVYSFKKVYFASNNLLSVNTPLVLRRKKCRAKVLNDAAIAKKANYIVLGSIVMGKNDPVGASVQIYSSATKKNLNVYLKKKDNHWFIVNHIIFED